MNTALLPLCTIARQILDDPTLKGNARAYSQPYLEALLQCVGIHGSYYSDDAESLVRYALNNLSTWRGETAKATKAELKAHLATL